MVVVSLCLLLVSTVLLAKLVYRYDIFNVGFKFNSFRNFYADYDI